LEARSWARACRSRCVLGERYFAKSETQGVSGQRPAAAARPAVARTSRACIIVYMLYFRIRRRLTSCRLCASHAATKCSPEASGTQLRPHHRLPQPCTFAGPNRSPPFLRRSAADSLFCAAPGVFASGCNTGPLSGAVTTPHAEPCTAGTLPKDSGVDGRRGGTYLIPSRGGDTPRGREATRCVAADPMRCGGTACGRGGTVTLGLPRGTWHGVKWADPMCDENERERE
jgi:hypothetical protein